MIPLKYYLILSAALLSIGMYGVLSRRNAIVALMSVELMLAAVNLNLVAFNRYVTPGVLTGQVFSLFSVSVAAAEAAIGIAIIITLSRRKHTVDLTEFTDLKG
jgi:NADH:ubiquinone oxidoreductase subunit K